MLEIYNVLEELPEEIKKPLLKALELLKEEIFTIIKKSDFDDFKSFTEENFNHVYQSIKELAEAQKRTEQRVEELAEAQKRTEQRLDSLTLKMEELAEAQKKTEQRLDSLTLKMEELAEAQKKTEIEVAKLTKGLHETRKSLGGLSTSISYAFENEAFRHLPKVLKEKYNIEVTEKFIREEINGKEINLFGKARKNGNEILIIGESKLRLDERKEESIEKVFKELEEKVNAVKEEYGKKEIIKVLVTHYATKGFLRKASEKGIIIVQSFEW